MTFSRKNQGTCSTKTTVSLDADGLIEHIEVADGCDGNLSGICKLLVGQNARAVIPRLQGTPCDGKPTSCPDQIALCLEAALQKQAKPQLQTAKLHK